MKLTKFTILMLALAAPLAAFATPVKLTNDDAFALFGALNQVKDGLTPANVGAASEDIWLLKGIADAYQSAATRAQRDGQRAAAAKDPIAANEQVQESWDSFRHAFVNVDFVLMTPLSDQEVKDSKITPAILAPIAHFLYKK